LLLLSLTCCGVGPSYTTYVDAIFKAYSWQCFGGRTRHVRLTFLSYQVMKQEFSGSALTLPSCATAHCHLQCAGAFREQLQFGMKTDFFEETRHEEVFPYCKISCQESRLAAWL
jgi:hypothetical protein